MFSQITLDNKQAVRMTRDDAQKKNKKKNRLIFTTHVYQRNCFQYLAITAVYRQFSRTVFICFQMSLKVNCVILTPLVVQNGMTRLWLLEYSGVAL